MLQPKDIDWLNGYKNKTCTYAVYFRPRDTYRLKVKGMEKDNPCKWKSKESWCTNSHIRKNRL